MSTSLRPERSGNVLWRPLPLPFSVRGTVRALFYGRRWKTTIMRAGLPEPLPALTSGVVRRTRLWLSEKNDLARELCSHFADGLAAGHTPEALVHGFGEPGRAARLMRRAKLRNRSWVYHAWIRLAQVFAALCLLVLSAYAYLAIPYFLSRPKITRNYIKELNAAGAAIPAEQRAWPMYVEALRKLKHTPERLTTGPDAHWPARPGEPMWGEAVAYVDAHQDGIELLARAAELPLLGYPLSDSTESAFDDVLWEIRPDPENQKQRWPRQPESDNPFAISVLLPYFGAFRDFHRSLIVDARRAIETKDAERFMRDIRASLALARFSADPPLLIGSLVGFSILESTEETIKEAFPSALLAPAQLAELAHRLAAFDDSKLDVNFDVERTLFDDTVQRLYSDDGHGNGRLTSVGRAQLASLYGLYGSVTAGPFYSRTTRLEDAATGPFYCGILASRAELRSAYDRLVAAARQDATTPAWERTEWNLSRVESELLSTPLANTRFELLTTLIPAYIRVIETQNRARVHRDATLVALSIELFKARNGHYPGTLNELVPMFLPAVPVDVQDGRPLKFALTSSGPVLYSVGQNRIDDGGVPGPAPELQGWTSLPFAPVPPSRPDDSERSPSLSSPPPPPPGDWILYAPGMPNPTPPPVKPAGS